jgi:hypothetical protein
VATTQNRCINSVTLKSNRMIGSSLNEATFGIAFHNAQKDSTLHAPPRSRPRNSCHSAFEIQLMPVISHHIQLRAGILQPASSLSVLRAYTDLVAYNKMPSEEPRG